MVSIGELYGTAEQHDVVVGGLPYVRPVIEISKEKVTFVSAMPTCDTCNSTGYTMGYWCTDCGELSNTIKSEISEYSYYCPPPCSTHGTWNVGEEFICGSCGMEHETGVPFYSVTYNTCNHTVGSDQIPELNSMNCPDCDIAYVYEDPEGGK